MRKMMRDDYRETAGTHAMGQKMSVTECRSMIVFDRSVRSLKRISYEKRILSSNLTKLFL